MALPFKPASDDAAVEFLRQVFGKVIDSLVPPAAGGTVTNESAAMLAEAFRYFNSGVLLFGSLIALYVTVFSVVNTANDGAALGKKWNTFYTPLRTVLSASALIPGANGYAMVQMGMLFIVCYSIGFASTMWTKVVELSTSQTIVERAQRSITDDPNFDSVATNALRMRMCAYGVNKAINSVMGFNEGPDSLGKGMNLALKKETKNTVNRKWLSENTTVDEITIYYQAPGWPASESICGKMTLTNTMSQIKQSGNDTLSADVKTNLRSSIEKVRNNYVISLFESKLNPIVDIIVASAESNEKTVSADEVRAQLSAIRALMMTDVSAAVSAELSKDNSNIVKNLAGNGWIYAGSYARELGRIKDAIRTATASRSEYTAGDDDALDLRLSGDFLKAAKNTVASYSGLTDRLVHKVLTSPYKTPNKPTMPSVQTSFSKSDFLLGGDGIKSMFSKYVTNLGDTLVTGIVFYMESDDDPVMRVKNVGDWMVTGAEAAIAVRVASIPILAGVKDGALASSVPGSAAVGGIAAGVLSFVEETWKAITPSMYTILYGGYFLSIWIPSVPYYIFGIGVVGWMIFVVEMMAAGVLWAAAHTTPTREDSFIGSQTQGYLLVMSGFFRPALMVLGLVASQAVINPIVHFVNESFVANFRSIQATSTTGLFSLAGFVLVYCFIMLAAFMLVFSLPQSLPDRILRWIGAGIQDIGEQNTASRIEAGASSQSRNAAMAAAKKSADGNKKSQGEKMSSKQNEHSTKGDSPEGISGQSTVTNPD